MPQSPILPFSLFLAAAFIACGQQPTAIPETETRPYIVPESIPTLSATPIAVIENYAGIIESIRILSPGPQSQVISPITLEIIVSSPDRPVRIELIGRTGALLARKILTADQPTLSIPIYFEINRSTTEAQLITSIEDEYGRLISLDSVAISLLKEGDTSIIPRTDGPPIEITTPEVSATVSGGSFTVTGEAASRPGRPLNIELVTREGRVIAFDVVYPTFEDADEVGIFSRTLNYDVEEPTWVLIAVSERQIGIIIHYASIEVLLQP